MDKFYNLLYKQLENLFFINPDELNLIDNIKDEVNDRFLYNCSKLKNKYYADLTLLSPYHSCQYLMFLYFCANSLFKKLNSRIEICDFFAKIVDFYFFCDIFSV